MLYVIKFKMRRQANTLQNLIRATPTMFNGGIDICKKKTAEHQFGQGGGTHLENTATAGAARAAYESFARSS